MGINTKIRSQFILSIIIFASVLLIIVFTMLTVDMQVVEFNNKENIISDIHNGANDLNLILDSYIIYQENAQIELWKTQFSLLSDKLTVLNTMNLQQQTIITQIENDVQQLNSTFANMILFLQNTPRNQSIRGVPEFQAIWSQLSNKIHDLIVNSEQLSHEIGTQADQLHLFYNMLVLILLAVFGVYFSVNYYIIYHSTLKSISKLQNGIAIIGSGNLDYSVKVEKQDEVGMLSKSFNQMTLNLKTITASKAELEDEVAKRKKAEATLETYNKNLEVLIEERTKQLRDSERLAAIGQIAGMVEHDIRNPLQAIVSELYLAKQSMANAAPSEIKQAALESVNIIQEQVDYINNIVSNLQDYAKPLTPELVEVDICQLIFESLRTITVPDNIQASVACEEAMPKFRLDLTYMRRILTNLVTNAIQAMPNGGKLTINASKKAEGIRIIVEDTGVGITKEAQAKLFTPLFTTKAKGQGFGLVVVKRMTEAQGGTIGFESYVGKGTKFVVSLPAQKG